MSTDLKFFTNEAGETLESRFLKTLKDVQFFDVLVGYFRTSGFKRLHEALENVEKIRILVGLTLDRQAFEFVQTAKQEGLFEPHHQIEQTFRDTLVGEMDASPDTLEMEVSARKFIDFIKSGKLELRAHPSQNIHAKVYISRFKQDDRDFGSVITGSSNFSYHGLVGQREFNVELKDGPDVRFALEKFEELWIESVDLSEAYVDTLKTKTWLSDSVTPYQLYLKFLYEYFKEDINLEELDFTLPDTFMELAYQKQAVSSAKKILETYGGVFIADVVGLGKTYIVSLLLQQLPGRKLIICPPVLADHWRETLQQFYVPAEVKSLGRLDAVLERGADKYQIIIVDEAHRFRNEMTASYEKLAHICKGKKVILVSATPLNNRLGDLLALLKLFQDAKASLIPGVSDLEAFFAGLDKRLKQFRKTEPGYMNVVKYTAAETRDKVLKHVMVRRTRSEIRNYFSEDMEKQGLCFPELAAPERIVYSFDAATEDAFNTTVGWLKEFCYARYVPLLYLKQGVDQLVGQSQRNVRAFMKQLLVKRLESSSYAFRNTVRRFIASYENFIEMLQSGTIYISKDVDVYDYLEDDDEAGLLQLLEVGKVKAYKTSEFEDKFLTDLNSDLTLLRSIEKVWDEKKVTRDCKLESFITSLRQNPILKAQKLIVFSESKETAEYLYRHLEQTFPGEPFYFSSDGGRHKGESYQKSEARERIQQTLYPRHPKPSDDFRILVTTDVLAEGISLHRSNVVVNYDLPWNPTRVLQRVGRVNRVGTEHQNIYVFNVFPTSHSDEHLGLEANIKAKIQAFHNTLGEDAKYLSDDEEVSSHGLSGDKYADMLYQRLNDREALKGEEDDQSELMYLQLIRKIRDDDPSLFEKIKRLPKKSRSASQKAAQASHVLSFFRRGRLKRFVLGDKFSSRELTFLEAARGFTCDADTKRETIPENYYELLECNKRFFGELTQEDPHSTEKRGGGITNEKYLLSVLRAREITSFQGFTDDDEAFLKTVRAALERGSIPRATLKTLASEIKKNPQPLKVLATFRNRLESRLLNSSQVRDDHQPNEVILSLYGIGES